MEQREIEFFVACMATAGLKEVKIPARVYYFISKRADARHGRDKGGIYCDIAATRIRPIYKRDVEVFETQAQIADFIKRVYQEI